MEPNMEPKTQPSLESKKEPKKISLIISIIVLLIIVGAVTYYLWSDSQRPSERDPFEFKVMDQSLTQDQINKYSNQHSLITQAIEQNPDNFDAWINLGMVKKWVGDYQGAEMAWIKAGEISPKNSTSFGNLADLYTNFLNDHDKAVTAYQTAITNSSGEFKNAMFYRNFYEFYLYNLEDKSLAEEVLLDGIENNPASTELLIVMASFYRDEGNTDKALEYYKKALGLDPNDELVKQEIEKLK